MGCIESMLQSQALFARSLQARREASAHGVLTHGAWLDEVREVVASTSFGSEAGHAEAAEGLSTDECAGDGSIEVEVADAELASRFRQVRRSTAENSAGQLVLGRIRDSECVVEILRVKHSEQWTEHFLCGDAMVGFDAAKNRGSDVGQSDDRFEFSRDR